MNGEEWSRSHPKPVLSLITPPSSAPIERDLVKQHLAIDDAERDTLIDGYIAAAVAAIDPGLGGTYGRALSSQTWEMRFHAFPCDEIKLAYAPLLTLDSVKYDDAAGVEQTLVVGTDYRVLAAGGLQAQRIAPAYGKSWPVARCDAESVRIRFTCGYAAGELPAPIASAILLMVEALFTNRSAQSVDELKANPAVVALLAPYRVY